MIQRLPAVASSIVLAVAFILASGCNHGAGTSAGVNSRKNDQSAREKATWTYWQSLKRIGQNGKDLEPQFKTATTLDQISDVLRKVSATLNGMSREVNSLPVLNVDPEVTTYAADSVAMFSQYASLFMDFANYIDEVKQYVNYTNSLDAGVEAFVRGFLGDGAGAYKDFKSQGNQFEQRRLSLLSRFQTLQERTHTIDAQEIKIRSTLSQRYNREFPKLDD